MELINRTKTNFLVGKDKKGNDVFFHIGKVMKVEADLAKTLLRYEGIDSVESLKVKAEVIVASAPIATAPDSKPKTELELLKEKATGLGIEFAGNVSKAKLTELVEEAETAPDSSEGE